MTRPHKHGHLTTDTKRVLAVGFWFGDDRKTCWKDSMLHPCVCRPLDHSCVQSLRWGVRDVINMKAVRISQVLVLLSSSLAGLKECACLFVLVSQARSLWLTDGWRAGSCSCYLPAGLLLVLQLKVFNIIVQWNPCCVVNCTNTLPKTSTLQLSDRNSPILLSQHKFASICTHTCTRLGIEVTNKVC